MSKSLRDLFDRFDLAQDVASHLEYDFADRCDVREVLAAAREDFDTQLVLQQTNLFADTGLRSKQALRRGRYVEIVVSNFPDVAQLLEFHTGKLVGWITRTLP